MESPKDVEVFNNTISIYWFDEQGILYSVSKKSPPQSLEEIKKNVEDFKRILNGRKVCMLLDVTYSGESSRDVKEYAANEFPKFVKTIAIISTSTFGRMLANLFFSLKLQLYPAKILGN